MRILANAPFGYFGSKKKIALQICKRLPPHHAWVEAFCGSAALTFAKKPAQIEIINDIDDQIVNLFDQLRKDPERLCKAVALTPYARKELYRARLSGRPRNNLEKARRFLIESMMAVNGVFGQDRGGFSYSHSYTRENREARVNRWYNLPGRLNKAAERLRNVRIENRDARLVVRDYMNRPATLLYLDPPYFAERVNGYKVDAKDRDFHKDLLGLASKAKCMIFISGYDNELYSKMLTKDSGWTTKRFQTTTRDSKGRIHKRTEVIWMNKYFRKAQSSRRVPIVLTRKEKRLNKVNPSR